MPALWAIISANADPMKRELAAVQRMANQTGLNIRQGLEGGGNVRSGAIRETLVLLREISRGNWNRVPGSFAILLDRLGLLSKLTGNQANAARILADAWELQAQKAGLAAIAATRKAGASLAAFEAEEMDAEAAMQVAIADEEAAAAAIQHAKATQAKAMASMEAAAASEVEGAAGAGALGLIGSALAVIAIAALTAYESIWGLKNVLKQGLDLPGLKDDYIPKLLRHTSDAANAQQKITDAVRKTVEEYGSAEARAKRVSDVTKEHYDHLRKIAELERNPAAKEAKILAINQQERAAELGNLNNEKVSLELEARNKLAEAMRVKPTTTAAEDERNLKDLQSNALAAEMHLDKGGGKWDAIKKEAAIQYGGWAFGTGIGEDERRAAVKSAEDMTDEEAQRRIQQYHDRQDIVEENKRKRKLQEDAESGAAKASAKAADIGMSIPDLQKKFAQQNKDEAELAQAQLANERMKVEHGKVNSLQQIGGLPVFGMLDVQRASLHELKGIHAVLKTPRPGAVKH
jgi:hypothetical protein